MLARLAGTAGASVQLARRPPVGIRGRSPAFRIFYWLKVREFDLFFLFLVLGLVLHVTFHLFVCCGRDVISVPSLMYCVKFLDRLREKFRNFYRRKLRRLSRAGEGSEDSGGYGLDFLQKATKRTELFATAEDKAFVSFACSRKLSELSSV